MAARQLRLLLWKDYLIRKRKVITLAGIIWATAVMISLYIVRVNVDNIDFPTCQFPARALPSAGMLTFLQSFICSVNNECSPMDQFSEIPTYENSKLTELQRKFAPLLYNETVIDVAGSVPDALKLLAKLADIVDEPTFIDITENGLRVDDLFNNPTRVKRYLSSHLNISSDVANSVMTSELSFQGVFKGSVDRCSAKSVSGAIVMKNGEHLDILVKNLCSLSDKDVQNILMDLMLEVNFSKFIKMIGNMYTKLSGDDRVTKLAATLTAVLRMARIQSFLPSELVAMISGDVDFTYLDLKLIPKLMDLFEPTFGDTEAYKSIREFADTAVIGTTYLSRFVTKQTNSDELNASSIANVSDKEGLNVMNKVFSDAIEVIQEATSDGGSIDVFNVLAQVTKFIYKWLPDNLKHDVLFYSTLLTKLIEGADKVININMHIEEKAYEVSLRHPLGVKVLVGLPGAIVGKGFEALTDAERTQIMTAKIHSPGQMFCDVNRIQGFFKLSKDEADALKGQLCTNEWKNYISDLIRTFGIYEVKDNINTMASLVIQETLGKDTSDQLYTIDYDFQVLKNFTQSLKNISVVDHPKDWKKLFNVSEDSEFMKTVRDKGSLGKVMLVVIHGALAKMVVNQNPILSYKISPALIDTTTLVTAINKQLGATEKTLVDRVKRMYPDILLTVLETALNENKAYKTLSTHSADIMCNGVDNAALYLALPNSADKEELVATMCDISTAIENGLAKDSEFGKAIAQIRNPKRTAFQDVKWTVLITGLKDLYIKLDRDYPYLLEYKSYNMNEGTRGVVEAKCKEAKSMWFGSKSIDRSLHVSVKLVFRLLDLMDRNIFNITDEFWLKVKYGFNTISEPARVFDDFVKLVVAISRNESYSSDFPPTTAAALSVIIPNAPQLILEAADNIVKDTTDLGPVISLLNADPPWPCSSSLTDLIELSPRSAAAVRGLETLGCDRGLRKEWKEHLLRRNVTVFNVKNWNTTTYSPHLFLKFSSIFDSLLEDASLLKELVEELSKEDSKRVTWAEAWRHVVELWGRNDRDVVLRSFLTKLDKVLNSINVTSTPGSLNSLWYSYVQCDDKTDCNDIERTTLKHTLGFFSVMFENIAADLEKYFREINEPNSSVLQILGFTRGTVLYDMYDKLPDYIGVLLNSYFDYGFMSQIRRASNSQFWDCEALVLSLAPPPGSRLDVSDVKKVQPFVCPSFLYWLSLPRGVNSLLDVVAKPQYYFYTLEAQNLTSSYSNAFEKLSNLATVINDIVNTNKTIINNKDIEMKTLKETLKNVVNTVLNYRINENNTDYVHFSDINQKQFASTVYMTRIVAIINKIATAIENFNIIDLKIEEEVKNKLEAELVSMQKIFKRRPSDIIAIHFDVLTDVLWTNNDNYNIVNGLETTCNNLKNNDTSKNILTENPRVKNQICTKNYKIIYEAIESEFKGDYVNARNSLLNLVKILQNGNDDNVTDIFEFLNQRKQLTSSMKKSAKYSYDLSIPIYLKYLQNNLQHYDVIISFITGVDWWKELRELYGGKYGKNFFDSLEKSFDIAENVLSNLDEIHIVRLLRDINVNNTDAFCSPTITLSDYLPDATAALSTQHRLLCDANRTELFTELHPLLFASQGYDSSLKLSREINYTALNIDISKIETRLDLISEPKTPKRPQWVNDEALDKLRRVALRLLSKETLTRISFGLLSNFVDAGTLFLNNSCTLCSEFTTWFKQLNLQVFKKQEYDNLLCHMHEMSLEDVHFTLKNNFHWDMAIRELISTRNYTNFELNKSINEFLEVVKLHLLEDIEAPTTKLSECLAHNVTRNGFGNATLFVSILSHTARLLRAEAPHLSEIDGITSLPYLKQLETDVAHKLDVIVPLKRYLNGEVKGVEGGEVNLRLARNLKLEDVKLQNRNWNDICNANNCTEILDAINNSLNWTLIDDDLPRLQSKQFWRFNFVSNILEHAEELLSHVTRLLGVASRVDLQGVVEGRLAALIDFLMQVLMEDTMNGILYSLQGIVEELHPLLHETPLESDLKALSVGLEIIQQFKNYVLEKENLNVQVSEYFPNADRVEAGLSALGINNTNFWSIAAPRVNAGHLELKPLFSKQDEYHISNFVCQMDYMSKVIIPANLDVVTADDVHGAIIEQFCGLDDERAKEVVPVLLENLNFSAVMEKVKTALLTQLYSASNLTESEGATVLEMYPQMAALLPIIQENVGDLSNTIAKEPLIQSLRGADSVGGLLSSAQFLSNAGQMLCGKPFQTDQNRFYTAIAKSQDFSNEPDQAQLDVLPTDFCRTLYKDIISMDGGKIVWSFVKPLIMGKILYTPVNPAVQTIIEKANSTFAHMIKLTNLIHSFSKSFSTLHQLSDHREGLAALRRIISSPAFSDIRNMLVGGGDVPDVDVNGLFDDFGDLQGVDSLLKKASDLLHCINMNRFQAVPDEYQLTHQAAKLSRVNEFSAGIVFLNSENKNGKPNNVEYKIRMDIENAPTTSRKKNYLWIPGPESSFIEHMRYFRGFIQIQDIIDRAVIELSRSSSKVQKRETKMEEWAVYTQQEPYPCYRKDFFQTSLYESQALIVAFFFSLLFTVSSAVRFVVADKETGNTMLMSVMGVNLTNHTLSWFIASALEMLVTCACIAAVLSFGGILPHTELTLLLALLFVFGLAVLAFCYMMSKLFNSASYAAVCTGIAYLCTFMPFIIILSLEAVMTSTLKLFVCLSMSSAICYSFLFVARLEAMGRGATWGDVWVATDDGDMSIGAGALMALADAAIYVVVGYLLDRYFGLKTQQSSITNCTTANEKAGVSIVNISKIYGEGTRRCKVALDNVSIELHKGQITTLLGHNGAGKTTLTNILTGMLKPTKGHVIIRSDEQTYTRIGVCPQRDVLIDCLSASEHVALYAQLKSGLTYKQVQKEVESMLQVLSLGGVAQQPVCRLSGGTRRRLCVALAFVAKPRLVSLDEPTAGVDPTARRDIWSMIEKLREDRTILLTTHHLDEAELLSDQIVIMHKGQIHTVGSPIEIKRSLGSGYKLTVMFPDKSKKPWADDEVSIEERTKQLLAVVREDIKNASLVDVNGLEVEVTLPFFDSNGLNNNYLQLCTQLEARKTELGYRSYNMDCSSLEQVFFNICHQADAPQLGIELDPDAPSHSASTSSIKNDKTPLVSSEGPLKGTRWEQFAALLHARYLHYIRNRGLLFLLIVLPSIFVATAMGFSMIRPPADNEVSLRLHPDIYDDSTLYLVPRPSVYSDGIDPLFAERVMNALSSGKDGRDWTSQDTPTCQCTESRQECELMDRHYNRSRLMLLPDAEQLNQWIVTTQEVFMETRYGGFTSSLKNNITNLVAWYNNKGHHAMPAYLNALNNAVLKAVSGDDSANITVYSHPLKISKEQISKDTVYQHIADAGISSLVLIAYSLVSGGAAIYLVSARSSQEKRLQLLCGVSPALYWAAALAADMTIIVINMVITAIVFEAFGFPVFVARNNLPAICLLILLYGYACGSFVHVCEKLFSEASLANMLLFCGNTFIGLIGITLLVILDIISDSDATDHARWVLHKVLLLCPQFVLGDGLLEIAKNTIQAQVLNRFGMDTYRDPLSTSLIAYHYAALVLVGTVFALLNLAIEYGWFEGLIDRFTSEPMLERREGEMEDVEVTAERERVQTSITRAAEGPLRLQTIGNINAGFVDTEVAKNSIKRVASPRPASDVAQCVALRKTYRGVPRRRVAVRDVTLGIVSGQCTALLGQNGAGKSTTFSMLTGEVRPSAGKIYMNEAQMDSRGLCRGLISYCPQSDAIDQLLTVRETLAFFCKLRGITEQHEVIKRTLDMFDLSKYAEVRNGTLSGGNKRKLCTAVAFMGRTPLVLLDEPTSGMDPVSRACVSRGATASLAARRGVLLSTHALDDARRLAARVAIMRAGELCALATLEDCLKRYGMARRGVLLSTHALDDARRLAARVAIMRAGELCALATLEDCLKRYGMARRGVLLSTHALDDARRLAARVAIMRAGELCALATLEDCLKRYGMARRGVLLSTHALDDARRLAARVAIMRAGELCALATLEDCLKRYGMARRGVLLSTHALDDARRLAARVAIMRAGELCALATLEDCLKRYGMARRGVLLSTHALDDARRLAARVAIMRAGELCALATLEDCLKRYGMARRGVLLSTHALDDARRLAARVAIMRAGELCALATLEDCLKRYGMARRGVLLSTHALDDARRLAARVAIMRAGELCALATLEDCLKRYGMARRGVLLSTHALDDARRLAARVAIMRAGELCALATLEDCLKRYGMARRGVLLSTHALDDARRLAARVAIMRAGELCALATLEDCLKRYGMARRGVLLSTHALDDARRLAARVAIMRAGELCALATLEDCLKRYGMARRGVLLSTHALDDARRLAARVAIMRAGELCALATLEDCLKRYGMARRGVLLSTHALDDARRLAARVAIMRAGELCALATLEDCLKRFGGGYIVACRCRGPARGVWRRVKMAAPHASLRVLHHATIHFLLPTLATVNNKETTTNLSDVFRLMAELHSTCDIEDYTVNQSSLDQMFLSFTERSSEIDPVDLEPLPSPSRDDELNSITSL